MGEKDLVQVNGKDSHSISIVWGVKHSPSHPQCLRQREPALIHLGGKPSRMGLHRQNVGSMIPDSNSQKWPRRVKSLQEGASR